MSLSPDERRELEQMLRAEEDSQYAGGSTVGLDASTAADVAAEYIDHLDRRVENVEYITVAWDAEQVHLEFKDLFQKVIGGYAFTPDQAVVVRDHLNMALERQAERKRDSI